MKNFERKIAVVTGATQGLGAAIATLFAERRAEGIIICGRSRDKGEAKADEISRATRVKVVYVRADVGQIDDCRNVIATADNGR